MELQGYLRFQSSQNFIKSSQKKNIPKDKYFYTCFYSSPVFDVLINCINKSIIESCTVTKKYLCCVFIVLVY